MNSLLSSVGGIVPTGYATQRSRLYDGVMADSVLQEMVRENV